MNIFKTSNQIVQEIHNEVDSAQERLLQQAHTILEKTKPLSDLGERLNKVGFKNSPKAKEHLKSKSIIVKTQEEAELIEYYKQTYPFTKFLTVEEFDRICNKYGLIYAEIGCYKKDVPEKNLSDIENCQELRLSDTEADMFKVTYKIYDWGHYDRSKYYNPSDFPRALRNGFTTTQIRNTASDISERLVSLAGLSNNRRVHLKQPQIFKINRQGLFIAAPKSHFDLKGKKQNGLGFFNMSIVEIKDPIVYRYVRGGIQVITKWGLEGKDEALFVDRLN